MTARKRIFLSWLVLVWTCGVTLLRAVRLPNDFAASHWYLDYRLGFIKRALVGSVTGSFARLFGTRMEPGAVDVLGLVTVALLVGLLLWVAWRLLVRTQASPPVMWAGLIFFSSPFIVMTAHLVGYFDAIFHGLTLLAVFLISRDRPWPAAAVAAVSVLVHESFLLTGVPLMALALFLRGKAGERPGNPWKNMAPLVLPLGVFVALFGFAAVTGNGAELRPRLVALWGDHGISPVEGERIAAWLTTPLSRFGREQAREFLPRLIEPGVLARTAPSLAALLALLYASTGLRALGRTSLVVLAVVFAPLVMHSVAWDGARIATYPVGVAFLALWILAVSRPLGKSSGAAVLLAVPVLFLNTFQHLPLMDGDVERFSILARAVLYLPVWSLALFLVIEQARRLCL